MCVWKKSAQKLHFLNRQSALAPHLKKNRKSSISFYNTNGFCILWNFVIDTREKNTHTVSAYASKIQTLAKMHLRKTWTIIICRKNARLHLKYLVYFLAKIFVGKSFRLEFLAKCIPNVIKMYLKCRRNVFEIWPKCSQNLAKM